MNENTLTTEQIYEILNPWKRRQYEIFSQAVNAQVFNIKKAKFFLPHYPKDCISRIIVDSDNYWDISALDIINNYLPDNAVILDIGANIGSHSVYWALERHAKKIYAFEPFADTFLILQANVRLNSLEDCIQIYNFGLMDETCRGEVSSFVETNIGGTSFKKSSGGNYTFRQLDRINIPEKIDLIKIDVEGAEIECLKGAVKTICSNKPVIVLETFDYKDKVDSFMKSISYKLACPIREGADYIYTYNP